MNAIRRVRTWIAPGCWVFEYTFSQGGTAHWRRVSEMFVLRTLLDDQRGTHTRVRAAGQLIRDEAPPIALVEGLRLLLSYGTSTWMLMKGRSHGQYSASGMRAQGM